MTTEISRYPEEILGEDEDNGTMVDSLKNLREAIIGHKIVAVRRGSLKTANYWDIRDGTALLLDTGQIVWMDEEGDCCAYTSVNKIIERLPSIEHAITGVGTTNGYQTWHIYADLGDVMELDVSWSCGNPFYYGYGFNITVYDAQNFPELGKAFKEITDGKED